MTTRSQSSNLWRTMAPLLLVIFFGFFGYALTVALFIPLLLSTHHGLVAIDTTSSTRLAIAGWLLAMYPLGQFIGSPIIGNLSDAYGRKRILVISLCLCIVGFACMALSIAYDQLTLLFISAFLTGLCESNMAIAQSVIADISKTPQLKSKFIGYTYSACSLGYICGPLIAGVVSLMHDALSTSFWITAIALIPTTLWIITSLQQTKSAASQKVHLWSALTSMRSFFNRPRLRFFYLLNFLIFFAVQGIYRCVPLYVQHTWQPSLHTFTLLITIMSAVCFVSNSFFLGVLSKRFSTPKLLMILLLFSAIFTIVIVFPKQFHWIWLTYGLAAIPTILAIATTTTWLSNHAGDHEQGQVLGNNQALLVFAEAASASIGGLIAAVHAALPIILIAVLFLITVFMIFTKSRDEKVRTHLQAH